MSGNYPYPDSSAIPHAPPLPAPRTLQRARDVANKLFGYQTSLPPSPEDRVAASSNQSSPNAAVSRNAALGAGNATAAHRTGLEINTIAINEKGTHALIGGKEIFKTIRVEDGVCAEDLNLRSAIRSTPRTASGKPRHVYSIDIADVAWARGDCSNYVAAATSSGKIILYDVGHAGLQAAQLHEHFRHVHKVTFNPHRGSLLLSGSQDGTVRLWDVRDVRSASTLQSKRKYSGLGDGVRDVKWSPTEGVEFAFGTDSGWVQCWDMRNLKTPKVKVSAHDSSCNAVDWHPDGKHILSAGADRAVRVWNLSGTSKRARSGWEIATPYPIFNARWRPSCETLFNEDPHARQCTQVVTSYDRDHPLVHIWDFRRPAIPFRELSPYPTAPTDFVWHSQDLLWSVGREGVFLQTDIQHAMKTMDRRNLQSFALSPQGEINCFTQRRHPHFLRRSSSAARLSFSESSSLSHSSESGSYGRSWRDDSLDNSFLSVGQFDEQLNSPRKSRASSISTGMGTSLHPPTVKLDEVLHNRKSFRPDQAAVRGPLPVLDDPRLFGFLANRYSFKAHDVSDSDGFINALDHALLQNAKSAQLVSLYRLSQTWEMVRVIFLRHLRERVQSKGKVSKDRRVKRQSLRRETLGDIAKRFSRDHARSPLQTPASMKPFAGRHLAVSESTSNVPTPQARPVINGHSSTFDREALPDPEQEQLALPPLLGGNENRSLNTRSAPVEMQRKLTTSNLTGLIKAQAASNAADKGEMVRRWSVQPKQPLDLDVKDSNGDKILPPKLEKHDSAESFKFLEASADSREASFPSSMGSAKSGPSSLQMVSERPSRPIDGASAAKQERLDNSGDETDIRPSSSAAVPIPEPNNHTTLRRGLNGIHGGQGTTEKSRTEAAFGADSYPDENGIVNIFEVNSRGRQQLAVDSLKPAEQAVNRPAKVWAAPREPSRPSAAQMVPPKFAEESRSLYHPQEGDVDIEGNKPFTMVSMLQELVSYYASHADVQTASSLIMLLTKLLPRTHPLIAAEAETTASSYMDALAAAGLESEDIMSALNGELDHLASCGMRPLQIESVLSTYHDRLVASSLWNEAASLRKAAYPAYPSLYDDALHDNTINLHCSTCNEPLTTSARQETLRCEKCKTKQGGCPICWSTSSPFDEVPTTRPEKRSSSLSTACLLCGHSGHAACLRMWFDTSGINHGGCPTSGCLCECADGSARQEELVVLDRKRRLRIANQRVAADPWLASESAAVGRARTLLEGGDFGKMKVMKGAGGSRGSSA